MCQEALVLKYYVAKKGLGKEAKLSHMEHILMENRNSLIVNGLNGS